MTLAYIIINAVDDSVIESSGFDLDTFSVQTAGAQWRVDLGAPQKNTGPFERYSVGLTNNLQRTAVKVSQLDAAGGAPGRTLISHIDTNTGQLVAATGTLAQIYCVVQKL